MRVETAGNVKKAPVIGFLAARFDEAYQNAVWRGAVREAERIGAALVFFGGQRLGSPVGYEALDNIAFDLAKRNRMAGLIVMSNVICTYLSGEEQLEFMGRFDGMRVVSVGIEFPHIPSVCIDASGGMTSIAGHLARVHSRRRFLFVAGPEGHRESESRLAEFLSSVSDLAREMPGNEAPRCIDVLYGDFNGESARDLVSRFLDSGTMPDAIVAANDLMAVGALSALSDRGIDVPRDVSVTGFDDTEDSRYSQPPLTTVRQPAAELGRLAVARIAARLGLVPQASKSGHPRVSFIVRESCGCPFSPETDEPEAGSAPIQAGAAANYSDSAQAMAERLAIVEGECRFQASQRLAAQRRVAVLGEIEASLVASFAMEDILGEIARGTRELGISGCYLSLFESKGVAPEWSKLLLVADDKGTRILAPYGLRFRTAELVPGGLPGTWSSYVCEPLRFGDDRLGYLICTADSVDRRMYAALRDQVSGALKGAMLMSAERDRERSLERMVRARTIELSAANARLVDEMSMRRNLERELLDISNLIMGKIGQDIHDNICQDIAGLGIMAAVLEGRLRRSGLAREADEAAALARISAETAARAKGIARGLYPAELEAKGIVSAVERLVESAGGRDTVAVRLEVTEGFAVRDAEKGLHLYRIVQEALNNALRHSQATEIRVGLYMDRETVTAEVSDDGIGMPPGAREENGMGLHILKYRASVMGGELRIQARDRGTTITCRVAR